MTQILKRLEIIKSSIAIEELEIIELQIPKLQALGIDDDVRLIIQNLEYRKYSTAETLIQTYLAKFSGVVVYEDGEFLSLKLELKSLESKLQNLIEQKIEHLSIVEEFNNEYNLHLGDLIKAILNLKKKILYKQTIKQVRLKKKYYENLETSEEAIQAYLNGIEDLAEAHMGIIGEYDDYYEEKVEREMEALEKELANLVEQKKKTKEFIEDETIEEEYKEAKANFDEYENEYKQTKENQKDVMQLSDDGKVELKKLFKKVARLYCHDIVPDEFKEKATQMMQQLNDACNKKDLKKIKVILSSLENGIVVEFASDKLEDKIKLQEKIKEYKQNIKDIEDELAMIMENDTYQTISGLDDWDGYFEELKSDLQIQKEELEETVKEGTVQATSDRVEDVPEWVQTLWNWADAHNIPDFDCESFPDFDCEFDCESFFVDDFENPFDNREEHRCIGFPRNTDRLLKFDTLELEYENIMKLPDELSNLTSLKYLILTNNPITNLPLDIGKLKYLIVLNLSECQLIQLPESITNLAKLEFLDLSSNNKLQITVKQQKWLKKLKNNGCRIEIDSKHFTNLTKQRIEKENTPYSKNIQAIENPSFEKIRRYCNNLTDENKADEMQKYLSENGKMYKALIYDALEQFILQLNGKNLTLVEWGCEQGIASMLVLDYIREKQLDIEVAKVILIDNDTKALSRAMAHNQVFVSQSVEISGFDSKDKTLSTRLKNTKDSDILHIFGNDTMPTKLKDVEFENFTNGYFMCISSVNSAFLEMLHSEISVLSNTKTLSSRDGKIGRFERFERIFKTN